MVGAGGEGGGSGEGGGGGRGGAYSDGGGRLAAEAELLEHVVVQLALGGGNVDEGRGALEALLRDQLDRQLAARQCHLDGRAAQRDDEREVKGNLRERGRGSAACEGLPSLSQPQRAEFVSTSPPLLPCPIRLFFGTTATTSRLMALSRHGDGD